MAVLDLQTGTRTILVRGGSHAHYVPSGHLVYAAAGTLRAVPFDLARLETRGTPVPVVPEVVTTHRRRGRRGGGRRHAGLRAGGAWRRWCAAHARVGGPPGPRDADPGAAARVSLSPAVTRRHARRGVCHDQESDIWVWDLGRTTLTRVTFDPGIDGYPVWTPDGRRVIFNSDRAGARNLFWQAADGTGAVERLTESPNKQDATAVSPDGRG